MKFAFRHTKVWMAVAVGLMRHLELAITISKTTTMSEMAYGQKSCVKRKSLLWLNYMVVRINATASDSTLWLSPYLWQSVGLSHLDMLKVHS